MTCGREEIATPRAHRGARNAGGKAGGGFTLVEILVAFAILVLILVGVLQLFDANNRLARVQTNLAEAQQSLRVGQYSLVRTVRMAGRGTLPALLFDDAATGFPGRLLPQGMAVEVRNNVPDGSNILEDDTDSPEILAGTDVLTVRGVFDGSIYQINPTGNQFELTPPTGSVTIFPTSPTGVPQPLEPLAEAIEAGEPVPIVLISPLENIYAVVELTGGDNTDPESSVQLEFSITGGDHTADYLELSPDGEFPDELQNVAFVGLLEEYRFYVRNDPVTTDLDANIEDPVTRLSRARVFAGTETAFAEDEAALSEDIADNVRDLQVALGMDTDGNQQVDEDPENPSAEDDWLFNADGDDDEDFTKWNGTETDPRDLYYVRITTLVRTDRPDTRYVSPSIARIEDGPRYPETAPTTETEREQRIFRRRQLTTVVDLRNLS